MKKIFTIATLALQCFNQNIIQNRKNFTFYYYGINNNKKK